MNEYEIALNSWKRACRTGLIDVVDERILQELVDKATPTKPNIWGDGIDSDGEIKNKVSLNISQIDKMKHALGYERSSVKRGKYVAYRNYYACGSENRDFQYLVFWGLAFESSPYYFHITKLGAEILGKILSVKIEL